MFVTMIENSTFNASFFPTAVVRKFFLILILEMLLSEFLYILLLNFK